MKLDLQSLVIFCVFFLPGIIWNLIAIKYNHSRYRSPSDTMFIIQSIVLSGFTYSIIYLIIYLFHLNLTNTLIVFCSIPLAFILSLGDLALGRSKLVPKFLKFLRLTDRYGNEDVWEHLLNKQIQEYVDIRDLENKFIYSGRVRLFSDSEKIRELYLTEVIVYDLEGNEIYNVPQMYISRPSETVIMEFRSVIEAKGKEDEKK